MEERDQTKENTIFLSLMNRHYRLLTYHGTNIHDDVERLYQQSLVQARAYSGELDEGDDGRSDAASLSQSVETGSPCESSVPASTTSSSNADLNERRKPVRVFTQARKRRKTGHERGVYDKALLTGVDMPVRNIAHKESRHTHVVATLLKSEGVNGDCSELKGVGANGEGSSFSGEDLDMEKSKDVEDVGEDGVLLSEAGWNGANIVDESDTLTENEKDTAGERDEGPEGEGPDHTPSSGLLRSTGKDEKGGKGGKSEEAKNKGGRRDGGENRSAAGDGKGGSEERVDKEAKAEGRAGTSAPSPSSEREKFLLDTEDKTERFLERICLPYRRDADLRRALAQDCKAVLRAVKLSTDPALKPFTEKCMFAKDFTFFCGEKRTIFCSKIQLWRDVCADTGLEIPRSTFMQWIPNFNKPRTRSDLCPVCKRGLYLLNAERVLREQGLPGLTGANAEALRVYRLHIVGADIQRTALKKKIMGLDKNQAVILTDFKQDWPLPLSMSLEQQVFFGPNQVANLVFVVITKGDDGTTSYEYCHFLQRPSLKDAITVAECLFDFSRLPFIKKCTELHFFADCGSHFQNRCILYHLLGPQSFFGQKQVTITFFSEHHGKSLCDSSFGRLTQAVFQNLNDSAIKSLHRFINYLVWLRDSNKIIDTYQHPESNYHFYRFFISLFLFSFFSYLSPFFFHLCPMYLYVRTLFCPSDTLPIPTSPIAQSHSAVCTPSCITRTTRRGRFLLPLLSRPGLRQRVALYVFLCS
jgi:hypothetical protein